MDGLYREQEVERMMERQNQLHKEQDDLGKINREHDQQNGRTRETKEKHHTFEAILERRKQDLEHRPHIELELSNNSTINATGHALQFNAKLNRASKMQDALRNESALMEDIEKLADTLVNEEEKAKAKEAIQAYQKYVVDQQKVEHQRQENISFAFESEEKQMWQNQEKIWRANQAARDRIFDDVLDGLKIQIDEEMHLNDLEDAKIEEEKGETTRNMFDINEQIVKEQEIIKQIDDSHFSDMQTKLDEQEKKLQEFVNGKREEEATSSDELQQQRKYNFSKNQSHTQLW